MSGILLNSPAEIIGQALVDDLLGGAAPWPVFINNNSKENKGVIVVLDTTGILRDKTQVDSESQEHYGIQFLIKHPQQPTCYQKANQILVAVNKYLRKVVEVGESRYSIQAVTPTSSILRIGKEQPEEVLFVLSLNVIAAISFVSPLN